MPGASSTQEFEQALMKEVPLARFSSLGIGGNARYFAEVASVECLLEAISWAKAQSLPFFILGGGTNIVIADHGFFGLALRVAIGGIETRLINDQVIITAGAGVEWDSLVSLCVNNDWAGIECLSGIPGRVGATPIQNVGAYGQEVCETLVSLEALDLLTNKLVVIEASECQFGYRTSRFKTSDQHRFIITSVTYRLILDGEPAIRYTELQQYLRDHQGSRIRLADVRAAVLAIRRRKGMVIDPGDPDSRSVGSFFVNPIVTYEEFEKIKNRTQTVDPHRDIPSFIAADNQVKLSAAWLIERAGFQRGYAQGNVGLSTKHTLAIINRGGGTASEVIKLADDIRARVLDMFGIALTPEPVFIGFELQDCARAL